MKTTKYMNIGFFVAGLVLSGSVIAAPLGQGSAWAWKTPIVKASGDENAVRAAAARALIASYLRYEGETRLAIGKAVLLVDHPDTPTLIAAQKKTARGEQIAALDELAAKFQKSPIHR